jgi:hypothetical protein
MIAYTKQFRKRMKDAEKSVGSFAKKSLAVGVAAGAVRVGFAGMTVAVGVLTAAYLEAAKTIPKMREFFDMAREAHVSAEFFQVWALAAQRAGIETKRFGVILRFTDARIRQYRNNQGEFAAGIKKTSQATQAFFENMKGLSNEEFLGKLPAFFASDATSAIDKNTVAVALATENAGAFLNQMKEIENAKEYYKDSDLLITNEEAENVRLAANALADINRHTDVVRDRAVAKNVESYVATRAGLEQLYLLWVKLLDKSASFAVNVATITGVIDPLDMVSTINRMGESYKSYMRSTASERRLQRSDQDRFDKLIDGSITSRKALLDSKRLIRAADSEELRIGKLIVDKLDEKVAQEKALKILKDSGGIQVGAAAKEEEIKRTQREIDGLHTKLQYFERLEASQRNQIAIYKEKNKITDEDEKPETGFYPDLLVQIGNTIKDTDNARKALARLKRERKADMITQQQFTVGEATLNVVLGKQESYYDSLLSAAKKEIKQTQLAENALLKLKAGFEALGIEEEEYLIIMAKVKEALGLDVEPPLTALGEVEKRIKEHREKLEHEAALIVAAKQLIANPNSSAEDIAAAQELFPPKDGGGGGGAKNKPIWELNSNESSQLFLKDFQSFSGQLSEAMLDVETDWDKFWLNMIKRMTQRNLARYISDAFQGMINTLKEKNAEVVKETKDITQNIQDATGGEGGFGWGALIGGVATLGAAYIMSRNMSNATAAASGSGGGGDVEVVVNINNSTQSNVQYDGRSITESGGIKRTVIDIIVEDYSQGGTLREVLG